MMNKRLIYIFVLAFLLNFVWEEFHSLLYTHYKGAPITHAVLLHAAFFDAIITTVAAYLFFNVSLFKEKFVAMIIALVFFAIGLEMWALEGSRWAYNEMMPIIPILNVGLTPTIQLALLTYLSFKISGYLQSKTV